MASSARETHAVSLQPLASEDTAANVEHGHGSRGGNPMLAEMEAPWANSRFFVVDVTLLAVLGGLLGVGSYGYGYIVGDLLDRWLSAAGGREYPTAYLQEGDGLGAWAWVPLCWAGGTAVGLLKMAVGLDTFDSFLVEIRGQHCDSLPALKTFVCCTASLFSGAALGPEAGLAAAGGGLGTLFARAVASLGPRWAEEQEADARRRLYVLGGIAAAFGTIMPAPWVSLLICVECSLLKQDAEGKKQTLFGRRTLFLLGITATVAFVVRYGVHTIPEMPDLGTGLRAAGEAYDNLMALKAVLLGAIAACASLVWAVVAGIIKVVFTKLGSVVERCSSRSGRIVGLCSLAGLLTGLLGYLVPMSLASGKEAMIPTMLHSSDLAQHASLTQLSTSALLWIALAKAASYGVAAAGGMVGGPLFPILYFGVVVGELCARIPISWSLHPAALTVPVVMVSVPSAVFPLPFTMVSVPLSYFRLGPLWCVPILAGIMTSYTLIVGTGLIRRLAKA